MARKPQITRTIKATKCSVLCMDLVEREAFNEVLTVPAVYKDEKKLMREVAKLIDNEERKAVSIAATEIVEQLYTMPLDFYMEHATPVEYAEESEG